MQQHTKKNSNLFFFLVFSSYSLIFLNTNVKIANKDCFLHSSLNCKKISFCNVYRLYPTDGRFGILGRAYYSTPWGKTSNLIFFFFFFQTLIN